MKHLILRLFGIAPDFDPTATILQRMELITEQIERCSTYDQTLVCKAAIFTLLIDPYPLESASAVGALNSILHWKQNEIKRRYV